MTATWCEITPSNTSSELGDFYLYAEADPLVPSSGVSWRVTVELADGELTVTEGWCWTMDEAQEAATQAARVARELVTHGLERTSA